MLGDHYDNSPVMRSGGKTTRELIIVSSEVGPVKQLQKEHKNNDDMKNSKRFWCDLNVDRG